MRRSQDLSQTSLGLFKSAEIEEVEAQVPESLASDSPMADALVVVDGTPEAHGGLRWLTSVPRNVRLHGFSASDENRLQQVPGLFKEQQGVPSYLVVAPDSKVGSRALHAVKPRIQEFGRCRSLEVTE